MCDDQRLIRHRYAGVIVPEQMAVSSHGGRANSVKDNGWIVDALA